MSDFFQFVAFCVIFSTLIYYNLRLELNNVSNLTSIFNQAQQFLIICSLVFLLGGIAQILVMRERFWEIANALNGIDNQVCF